MTDTTETDLVNGCERERLDRIGAIQPFGVLLAGDPGDDRVRAASADAGAWLCLGAGPVLGRSLASLVPLTLDDFPPAPGGKRVIAGLACTPHGRLDALLSNTGAGWLLELEPPGLDVPCPPIADPYLVELVLEAQSGASCGALLERAILDLVQADGAVLLDAAGIHRAGLVPTDDQVLALDDWCTRQVAEPVWATDCLAGAGASAPSGAAGVLAVRARARLASGADQRCYWFRAEQARTVHWAGDPRKPVGTGLPGEVLNPRHSFDLWVEHTSGHSAPWDDLDLMAARKLRLLLLSGGMRAGGRG